MTFLQASYLERTMSLRREARWRGTLAFAAGRILMHAGGRPFEQGRIPDAICLCLTCLFCSG
jgi:hypothetical protein